ncbi:MAG TPA: response regulator transcription factor [Bacteroidetes bacterium]|nr:response regulator transcription factor [Bacteroidota bacterium]
MDKKIKIIIVDDHEIFRKGLTMVINQFPSTGVIAEASNGKEFLSLLNSYKPDIVFMDIRMPVMDGIEATKKVIRKYPDIKIIAISMFGEEEHLENMIKAGAKGFLLKNINTEEIEYAIKQVASGNNYYSSELLPYFTNKFLHTTNESEDEVRFTRREMEILKLVTKGLSSKEIGAKLFISKRTVDGHKANMINKTGSKNVIDLLIYAIKNNLVKI